MCTLIVGRDVLGSGTILLGANRDEDPARPTDPPGILNESPRLVGGRDRLGGGTWLALREGRAAFAILNRHDPRPAGADVSRRRSRGLLLLDVAATPHAGGRGLGEEARESLERARGRGHYAQFSLVFASREECWLATAAEPEARAVAPGWHVLTHRELDDPDEPRAAHLLRRLQAWRPRDRAEAEEGVIELLRSHGEDGGPSVCIHDGPMPTVSSSVIWLAAEGARYLHAEGRPCERPHEDQSALVLAASAERGAR